MSIEKNNLVAIRDFSLEDKNFIMATWMRGLRYGNDWFEAIDKDAFYKTYQLLIEAMLANKNTSVKVACLKDDADVILGYSIYAGPRLDWVFVKKAWRGIGIAKTLVPDTINTVSHLTVVGRSLLKKYPKIVFNPFNLG